MRDVRNFSVNVGNRVLNVLEAGIPDGIPVLFFHGTPGSKLIYTPSINDAESKGIRLIGFSRPGYGESTPQPGRRISSVIEDVEAIIEALKIETILVYGMSGGGPHALACAALLPGKVKAAATLASVAPFDAEDLDFFKGMGESNITEFNASVESRESLAKNIEEQTEGMLNTNPEVMVKSMKSILCPEDAQAMTLDFAEYFIKSCREGIGQRGDGWIDDDFAFTSPWGFQLNCVSIPVLVMHGEQDQMVPFPHGQWIADQIPGVERRFYHSDGHITLKDRVSEVHDWLLSKV
jgi:pimeloyl-ACP methyl ester carboxylesterase